MGTRQKHENEAKLKELGSRLRKAREAARLTQADIADKAGVNASYYAEIERGEVNPSVDKLYSVLKALRVKSFNIL